MCDHYLGTLPCDNPNPHKGAGLGCTHTDTSCDVRGQEKADGGGEDE